MDLFDDAVSEDYSVTSFEWSDEENNYERISHAKLEEKKTETVVKHDSLVTTAAAASCRDELLRCVSSCYKSSQWSDLVIHCRGGKLPGHRLVLAAADQGHHRSLLQSDPDIADIFLLDYDVSSVATALQLLYTGNIVVNTRDQDTVRQILGHLGIVNYDSVELGEPKKKKERQKLKVKHEKNLGSRRIVQESKALLARKKRVFMSNLDPSELTCDICGKSFPALYKLKIHKLIHSDSFPFMCMKCGKGFNNKYKMHSHEKKKLCDALVQSKPINNEQMSKPPPRKLHQNIYHCKECTMTFSLIKDLKKHVQLVHRVKSQLTCVHCSTVCRSQKTLITHLKVVHNDHESGLKCSCGVCGKKFQKLSNLEDHILRHSEIKQFGCMYCPKRCATKQDLDRHLRSHSGEASFTCQFCSRRFVHRKTYTNHVRKHLGQKPYHCKPCNKSFAALTYLKKHQVSHQRKGDATKLVTGKKTTRGTTTLTYIDHLSAPEDPLEAAVLDSKLLDHDHGHNTVYIPGSHYIQTGDTADTGGGVMQVITDYTGYEHVSSNVNKTPASGYDHTISGGKTADMSSGDLFSSKDLYQSKSNNVTVFHMDNVTPLYDSNVGNNDDENSRDDGYLLGLFENQPQTTTLTTLDKL